MAKENDRFINTSRVSRTPEETAAREGAPADLTNEDLDQDQPGGYVGHEKGGADVKFVTKAEQAERREKTISEIERNFAEYVRANAELIGTPETYQRITGESGSHTETVTFAKDRMHHKDWLTVLWTEHGENEKFLVFTGPDNMTYKIVLRLPKIPGALEALKTKYDNNIPTFLLKMFQHYFNSESGVTVQNASRALPSSSLATLCQQMESKFKK